MSIRVKCTIELSDEKYEAGTQQQEIFKVVQYTTSTGVFSTYPELFARRLIEGASISATEEALKKLKAIKGNILSDDEDSTGVMKDNETLTRNIYKAMQTPYLSERHDAILTLIRDARVEAIASYKKALKLETKLKKEGK